MRVACVLRFWAALPGRVTTLPWVVAAGAAFPGIPVIRPALIRPFAIRLIAALEAGDRPAEVRRLRAVMRALQEGKAENEGEEEG
ncbi:hypothetical protein DL764_001566 [Monosporascus ibericus]|uniref:Uncharacterized protein n=1 Tax=Monosporascus ibericus TaxID=155417 RepID=A0A4Q4TP02_9PEZI|nr:hypothetical protein DL764_001566 [Monosporascus ibericus]